MGISRTRRAHGVGSGDATWIRRGVVVAALALGAGLLVGVSGASAPSVDVDFTPLSPPKKVLSNAGIGAGVTKPVVISGGTTTVPTNATTVLTTVTARGAKAGTLHFHPLGDPSGSSGQTVSWAAGGSATEVIATDVGQKNSVAIVNESAGSATVTVTIQGYSTEVEVDDISSQGGSMGQVLTDTGDGAAWQDPALPTAYFGRNFNFMVLSESFSTILALNVPAGRYQVEAFASARSSSNASENSWFLCELRAPNGDLMGTRQGNLSPDVFNTSLGFNGIMQTGGGSIILRCFKASGAQTSVYETTIMATRVEGSG